ncbi:MAG: TolC family protein [Ignavibacteria bacterium]|nr:TolC family protein [Ignavibacteria bacterium]
MVNATSRTLFLFALLATLVAPNVSAQPKKYTLKDCIRIGMDRSPDLQRSANDIERSATYKQQALGAFLPSLNASAAWTRSDKDNIVLRGDNFFTSRNSYSYNVSSAMTLFDGMSNILNADRSILGYQAAEKGHERMVEDVVYRIHQGYFNALRLQELVKVNQSNLERSRKQLDRIKELNAVGSVPLADVYRQQVQAGRDELGVLQAENDSQNALIDLQTLLGLAIADDFALDASAIPASIEAGDMQQFRSDIGSEEASLRAARLNRKDVQQADLTLQSARKSVSIAWSGHLPSLSAFASYNWGNAELKDFSNSDFTRFSYGLQLQVPIFNNFLVSTAVQRAEIDRMDSETMLSTIERSISADMRKAMNTLTSAEKNLEITKRTLFSAQEDQRIATERYSLGAGTLLDVIVANSNLTAAQSDVVNSTFNYLIARKQVEYQLGTITN